MLYDTDAIASKSIADYNMKNVHSGMDIFKRFESTLDICVHSPHPTHRE